jgi:hypothetical protein
MKPRFLMTATAIAAALTATATFADTALVWSQDTAGKMYGSVGNINTEDPASSLAVLGGTCTEPLVTPVIFDEEGVDIEAGDAAPQGTRFSCNVGIDGYVALLARNAGVDGAPFELGMNGIHDGKLGWSWNDYNDAGKSTLAGVWEPKHDPADADVQMTALFDDSEVGAFLARVNNVYPANPEASLEALECGEVALDRVAIETISHTYYPENPDDAVASQWGCAFGLNNVYLVYLDEVDEFNKQFTVIVEYALDGVAGDAWASYDAEGVKTLKAVHDAYDENS